MKRSFFEKSFITTLLLFLVLLNAGLFTVSLYNSRTAFEAAKQVCRAEQYCISEAFTNDSANKHGENDDLLFLSYGKFYLAKNIMLKFADADGTVYSTLPEEYPVPESGMMTMKKYDGVRIMMISDTVCDGKYVLTYAKDISYLDRQTEQLVIVIGSLSVICSALLAVMLYFIQKRLLRPLKGLQKVTNEIAGGDLSSRADDSGNDEFALLARDFNTMADKIDQRTKELLESATQKQRMLDDLAHEMRTPLTSIHGYAEYAFGITLSEEERMKAMNAIMQESMRLKNISTTLLDMAFLRENRIEPKLFRVLPMLERTASRARMIYSHSDINITVKGEDTMFSGDETLVEVLLTNLVENACKACKNGGNVVIYCIESDSELIIGVSDDGIGMTEEQLHHITEPFYRTDRSRDRKQGGTGLGLALCKQIADAHNARLLFTSEPGRGTKAEFISNINEM